MTARLCAIIFRTPRSSYLQAVAERAARQTLRNARNACAACCNVHDRTARLSKSAGIDGTFSWHTECHVSGANPMATILIVDDDMHLRLHWATSARLTLTKRRAGEREPRRG